MKRWRKTLGALLTAAVLLAGLMAPATANDVGVAGSRSSVVADTTISAAIDTSGNLWMWGNDGDRIYVDTRTNVPVKALTSVASVSCGYDHTAAIKSDGSLWTWGYNAKGQLGRDTNKLSSGPAQIMNKVSAVSCGSYFTAAIKTDGSLWTWGDNSMGQLGNGTQNSSYTPAKIMDNVIAVSCGAGYAAAIKSDGSLWLWGTNSSGQLGNGLVGNARDKNNTLCQTTPVMVMEDVISVSCSDNNTAAVTSDGSLWLWGNNTYSQLGSPKTYNETVNGEPTQTVPVEVMDDVVTVSCGYDFTAVVKTDGTLWTWGSNRYGQLGNGGVGNRTYTAGTHTWRIQTIPRKVTDKVAYVSCGYDHTVILKTDGTLWSCGSNAKGQLGTGKTSTVSEAFESKEVSPVKVLSSVVAPAVTYPTVAGFRDVHSNDYYAAAVKWAKTKGITTGTTATTFSPNGTVARADAIVFLWRTQGKPEPTSLVSPFTDVTNQSAYYYKAVLWAAEQGITNGVENNKFGVSDLLTYAQVLAFLCRADGGSATGANWSADALAWAKAKGITTGLTFTAQKNCPRCDVVYCLWKWKTLG
jgi:alpha-tubulin suppressor-like RCC1 family protein